MAGHRLRFGGWLALALLGLACHVAPARAGYLLVDRGALAVPNSFQISGMSANGIVVGTATVAGVSRAYVVQPGNAAMPIPVPGSATSSQGLAINERGDVTGSFNDPRFNNVAHAFRYTAGGGFEDLGTLPNGSGVGTAISAGGIVAGYGFSGGVQRAFGSIGNGTSMVIDPLSGGRSNYATGVNSGGMVVGTSDVGNGTSRAFLAMGTSPAVDLLAIHPGSGFSGSTYATGINDRNSVIGYGGFGSGFHAFIAFDQGPMIDLGVAGGAQSSLARALNGSDQVVGVLDFAGGLTHAFFWDQARKMIDLNTILSADDRASWVLTQALTIGTDGSVSGLGYRNGELHAFTLQGFGAVPEPSTALLLSFGLGAVAISARVRRGRSKAPAAA